MSGGAGYENGLEDVENGWIRLRKQRVQFCKKYGYNGGNFIFNFPQEVSK